MSRLQTQSSKRSLFAVFTFAAICLQCDRSKMENVTGSDFD